MNRRTIIATCLPIISVNILLAIIYSHIWYTRPRHEVMKVTTVRTENQITHIRMRIRAGVSALVAYACICVVFRDFLVKFREMISEVGKLKTNLRRPVLDICT